MARNSWNWQTWGDPVSERPPYGVGWQPRPGYGKLPTDWPPAGGVPPRIMGRYGLRESDDYVEPPDEPPAEPPDEPPPYEPPAEPPDEPPAEPPWEPPPWEPPSDWNPSDPIDYGDYTPPPASYLMPDPSLLDLDYNLLSYGGQDVQPQTPTQYVSWEDYLARHPASPDQQTSPYWDYMNLLAEQSPYAPAYSAIYGDITNVPSWVNTNEKPSWLGNPLQPTDPIMNDINRYTKNFQVGGNVLPGGYGMFGLAGSGSAGHGYGGFYLPQDLTPISVNPQWVQDFYQRNGYVWNPYGGDWELGWDRYKWQEGQLNAPPRVPRRRGGGSGGETTQLQGGVPNYEAYWPFATPKQTVPQWRWNT